MSFCNMLNLRWSLCKIVLACTRPRTACMVRPSAWCAQPSTPVTTKSRRFNATPTLAQHRARLEHGLVITKYPTRCSHANEFRLFFMYLCWTRLVAASLKKRIRRRGAHRAACGTPPSTSRIEFLVFCRLVFKKVGKCAAVNGRTHPWRQAVHGDARIAAYCKIG